MNIYFTLDNYTRNFLVINVDKNISVYRIGSRDKIWNGIVKDIFIGKSCLNEMTEYSGARDNEKWDGNTILLMIDENEYIFIGNTGIYSFKTNDKIIKFTSNVGNSCVPYAVAYGEKNIYYLSDGIVFIPYESILDENIRKNISEMNESYEPYSFLYDRRDGERIKFYELSLIAPRFADDDFERYFNYLITANIDDDDDLDINEIEDEIDDNEIYENIFYNGSNDLVKIFNQLCVICLDKNSVYAFRKCGHLCLCEECYDSKITKCVVCRS